MIQSEKPTIMDIARMSGLSKGTVDRVLHNRGEVSKKSYEKVMAVIKELGYEPNVFASALARGVSPRIAVLIPLHGPGSFWELALKGISKASGLAAVCERLGIAPAECLAIGDNDNDVEMFDLVGHAIAMETGSQKARAHARETTPSANDVFARILAAE